MKNIILIFSFLFSGILLANISPNKINKYCNYYEFDDCNLVKSIIKNESNFNPKAFNPEKSGSYGLMQVQCTTAKMMGLKYSCNQLYDAQINIRFGILYLKYLKKKHEITEIKSLIAGYNAGKPLICKNYNPGKCYPGEYINQLYVWNVYRHYIFLGEKEWKKKQQNVLLKPGFLIEKKEKYKQYMIWQNKYAPYRKTTMNSKFLSQTLSNPLFIKKKPVFTQGF